MDAAQEAQAEHHRKAAHIRVEHQVIVTEEHFLDVGRSYLLVVLTRQRRVPMPMIHPDEAVLVTGFIVGDLDGRIVQRLLTVVED
eukprot:5824632-Heterocapsa_arctica.AAC.1